MGSSTAFHLLTAEPSLRVVIVEMDPSFSRASSALSMGNARIQFSLAQNIEISKYALEILERFSQEMEVDGECPDVAFKAEGNLFVVDEDSEMTARDAVGQQRDLGCTVEWWSPEQIVERFPLIEVAGYRGGTYSSGDGHLDGYAFLMAYRRKAASLGAALRQGRIEEISCASGRVEGVVDSEGQTITAPIVVNCAGAWAAPLLSTLGIDLPVLPVQRQVFVIEPEIKPTDTLPLVHLPSGLYFRSEGEHRILVGKSLAQDRVGDGLRWEERRFYDLLWPEMVEIVPAFERLRLERGWAGLYAVNKFDGSAILGEWPEIQGLYLANGFSGHGLQQAPAVGRYMAELILDREPALDLSIFSPERLLTGRAIRETALV